MILRSKIALGFVASVLLVAAGCGGGELDQSTQAATVSASNQAAAPGGDRFLARFDQNHDGVVQVAELPARAQERFATADANHDGALTSEEVRAHMEAQHAARFASADANHDGALTENEVEAGRWAHLSQADADHDSRVTLAEMQAHAPRGRGMHHGPHGFGRGGMRHGPPDPAMVVQHLDRNGDGLIQRDEARGPLQMHFDQADADHNGAVSQAELTTAMAQFRPPPPPEGAPIEGPEADEGR